MFLFRPRFRSSDANRRRPLAAGPQPVQNPICSTSSSPTCTTFYPCKCRHAVDALVLDSLAVRRGPGGGGEGERESGRGLRRRPSFDVTPTLNCCPRRPSCVHFRPVLAMLYLEEDRAPQYSSPNGTATLLQRPLQRRLHHRTELAAPAAFSIGAASAEGSDAQPPSRPRYDRIGMQNTLADGAAYLCCACACCSERETRERVAYPSQHALAIVWPRGRLHLAVVA